MDEKYWKQFEASGRIEDYLTFVSKREEAGATNRTEQVKQGGHAGIYNCNGNDTQAVSHRGVRQTYQPFD